MRAASAVDGWITIGGEHRSRNALDGGWAFQSGLRTIVRLNGCDGSDAADRHQAETANLRHSTSGTQLEQTESFSGLFVGRLTKDVMEETQRNFQAMNAAVKRRVETEAP